MKENTVKGYFKGTTGMSELFDMSGNRIFEGDTLSNDCGDYERYGMTPKEGWETKPTYKVMAHLKGGLFAEGLNLDLYLHDFRFKFTHKIITEPNTLSHTQNI